MPFLDILNLSLYDYSCYSIQSGIIPSHDRKRKLTNDILGILGSYNLTWSFDIQKHLKDTAY